MQAPGGDSAAGGSVDRKRAAGGDELLGIAKRTRRNGREVVVAGPDPEPSTTVVPPTSITAAGDADGRTAGNQRNSVTVATIHMVAPRVNDTSEHQSNLQEDTTSGNVPTLPPSTSNGTFQPPGSQSAVLQPLPGGGQPNTTVTARVNSSNTIGLIINPAPIPAGVRRLKMVHFCDLLPNTTTDGQETPGVPKYKTDFDDLFDHTSDDIMFDRGGPTINVYIPGQGTRTSADYHVMLCDVQCCYHCNHSTSSALDSGIAELKTANIYQGLPFAHDTDVQMIKTSENTIISTFRPHWTIDFNTAIFTPQSASIRDVVFYEGGRKVIQQTNVCRPETCPKCTQGDEAELHMVHRKNLLRIPAASDWAHLAGNKVTYACSSMDTATSESDTEWFQQGPVMKVFVHDLTRVSHIVICQYQACNSCADRTLDSGPRPHTSYRLPFVHRKDCSVTSANDQLTFNPRRYDTLDQGAEVLVERRSVLYAVGVDNGPMPVMSAVCTLQSCPTCSPAEAQIRAPLLEQNSSPLLSSTLGDPTSGTQQQGDLTGVTDPTSIDPSPAEGQAGANSNQMASISQAVAQGGTFNMLTESSAATASNSQQTSLGAGLPASIGGNTTNPQVSEPGTANPPAGSVTTAPISIFRMCHLRHLDFRPTGVVWNKPSGEGGPTVNNCFVANDWESLKWGGPVYRVSFPDNTQQDVMACRRHRCKSCNKRASRKTGQPTAARPFVHRREIRLDAFTQIGEFRPAYHDQYSCPDDAATTAIVSVNFGQAGARGTSSITTQCEICTEGNCTECDDADAVDTAAASANLIPAMPHDAVTRVDAEFEEEDLYS